MTDQEILEKAIKKAVHGGWDYRGFVHEDDFTPLRNPDVSIYEIIFNHDFAKALWGGEPKNHVAYKYRSFSDAADIPQAGDGILPICWWHLQQMVIAEDPIKYLGENL